MLCWFGASFCFAQAEEHLITCVLAFVCRSFFPETKCFLEEGFNALEIAADILFIFHKKIVSESPTRRGTHKFSLL